MVPAMDFICLGTGSGTPTKNRNVSGYALRFDDGSCWIFDCGEGTQQQMLHSEVRPGRIDRILISHAHGDHCYGLPGLLASIAVHDRGDKPVEIIGPKGIEQWIRTTLKFSSLHLPYPLSIVEMPPNAPWQDSREGWWIAWQPLSHRVPSGAFILTEPKQPGRFDPQRAHTLGVPDGPERGRLVRGQSIMVGDQEITPAMVCKPPRRQRVIGLLGDTNDSSPVVEQLRKADFVLHECTFADSRGGKAKKWRHSTVADCIHFGQQTRPKLLVLTHFSSRYDQTDSDPTVDDLRDQVQTALPHTTVMAATDLAIIPIPAVDE
jgi:ribonuclease Z